MSLYPKASHYARFQQLDDDALNDLRVATRHLLARTEFVGDHPELILVTGNDVPDDLPAERAAQALAAAALTLGEQRWSVRGLYEHVCAAIAERGRD